MWKELEQRIRRIASYRWNCNATTETIAGVKCDCVLKPQQDEWIVVEITEESSITKVRTDIAKLWTVKNALLQGGIFAKCYFVMKETPTDSMRAAGKEQHVQVRSAEEFQNEFFDYSSYVFIRKEKQFGSLINIETGEPEKNTYVDVFYINKKTGTKLSVNDIISLLKSGKKIILKGDFGLGKSRCVKQVFDKLTQDLINNPYTIAINLREHWGAKRATEIINRHFEDLALDAKNIIKTYEKNSIVYLLDGFDEIGTQSWSIDANKMQYIRAMSVCAVKDLMSKVQGGILITGREYYFNSDQEMLKSLGLSEEKTLILECQNEFSDAQLMTFITKNLPEADGNTNLEMLPSWLPKRPLVIQLLVKYANDILSVDEALDDLCGFWHAFFTKICERESRIYPSLNPDIIKNVLLSLADNTRSKKDNVGPISQQDLSNAFEAVAGFRPNDESSIMLQRLPSLGRISADSPDRQFLDGFILNGLRAESIIQICESRNDPALNAEWKHPLGETGLIILSQYISKDEMRLSFYISVAKRASNAKNAILSADIVSAVCLLDVDDLDFKDLSVTGAAFTNLSFEGKKIHRLTILDSDINQINLTNSQLDQVIIRGCIIDNVYGISSSESIPSQIVDCEIMKCEALSTTALIRRANLSEAQKMLVEMLKKIFLQPGAGRKEAALLRGMGVSANKKMGEKILRKLLDEKIIERHKGDEGWIYGPERDKTRRVKKLMTDLTLSKDPLWTSISELSK